MSMVTTYSTEVTVPVVAKETLFWFHAIGGPRLRVSVLQQRIFPEPRLESCEPLSEAPPSRM